MDAMGKKIKIIFL